MPDYLVVLDQLPHKTQVPAAAAAWQGVLGGLTADHARAIRSSTGVLVERLDAAKATALAHALAGAGLKAWALPMALVPRLPKPRVASRFDLSDPEALAAQIALTGPPERVPWRQIVLALPATLQVDKVVSARKTAKKVGIGTLAMAATTGVGAGKVISAMRGKGGEDTPAEIDSSQRPLVELVAVAPYRRLHAYGDRLDYSTLDAPAGGTRDNFALLLQTLRARLRPGIASDGALTRFIDTGAVPASLQVKDASSLALVSRWLLLRSAAIRLQGG